MQLDQTSTNTQISFVPKKLHDLEREHIIKSLIYFRGNRLRTAKALGIAVRTIRNKIEQYEAQGHFILKNLDHKYD